MNQIIQTGTQGEKKGVGAGIWRPIRERLNNLVQFFLEKSCSTLASSSSSSFFPRQLHGLRNKRETKLHVSKYIKKFHE